MTSDRTSRVLWGELTSEEIGAAGRAGALALVPLGCTEQHGLHLPVDTDTYQVERLAVEGAALAAASGIAVLVLPTLPFGPASEHYGYPGTISIDSAIYLQMIGEVIRSILDSGFRRIGVLHGCGGHWVVPAALWDAKAEATRSGRDVVIRHIGFDDKWRELQRSVFPGTSDTTAGHAGVMETALCLSGRAGLVRLDRHRVPTIDRLGERYHAYGEVFLFSEMSDTGALGDATGATVEGGAHLWREQTAWLAQLLVAFAQLDGAGPHTASPDAGHGNPES